MFTYTPLNYVDEEIDATKVPSAFSEGKKAKIIAKNGPKIMKLPS